MLACASAESTDIIKYHQKISDTEGDFAGQLSGAGGFGRSVASLGDLDGDGTKDIAVGAPFDDDGGTNRGATWILFLNTNGTVKSHQKISDTEGDFAGQLSDGDFFGSSVASLGDLDGDGTKDIAVGAIDDDDGGTNRGATWILFLNTNGTVKSHQKISDTEGDFAGQLSNEDFFGSSVASLGDLDGDGATDIAVGASEVDGFPARGATWILFLNTNGTVKSHQYISDTEGDFAGQLTDQDWFGVSVASLGDLDGDGTTDIAVGAPNDEDGGTVIDDAFRATSRGATWILFLNTDGTVKSHQKISDTEGDFAGQLDDEDWFGVSVASLGDLDGDGATDIAVGARNDDDGGGNHGATWILFLNTDGTVKSHKKISDTEGDFAGQLSAGDTFGFSVASLGDLDGDGSLDIAVGAPGDDDGGGDRGAAWILFSTISLPSPSASPSPSATSTASASPSPSTTSTASASPSTTSTASASPSATSTASASPSPSTTSTASASPSPSATSTASASPSPSTTSTASASPSPSTTSTASASPSPSTTSTASVSPSTSPLPSGGSISTGSPSALPPVPIRTRRGRRVPTQEAEGPENVQKCYEPSEQLLAGQKSHVLHNEISIRGVDPSEASCGAALTLVGSLAAAASTRTDEVVVWFERSRGRRGRSRRAQTGSLGETTLVLQTPLESLDEAAPIMRAYETVLASPVLADTLGENASFNRTREDTVYAAYNPYSPDAADDGGDNDGDGLPVPAVVGAVVGALVLLGVVVVLVYFCNCCKRHRHEASEQKHAGKDSDTAVRPVEV